MSYNELQWLTMTNLNDLQSKRKTKSASGWRLKGAFIIYVEGGYADFEGGHSFSLLWFGGGFGKFPMKMTSSIGGPTIFFWKRKGNENMLLDALIIPVFYFISTKCWYETWCMTPTSCARRSLCEWLKLTLVTLLTLALLILTLSKSWKMTC